MAKITKNVVRNYETQADTNTVAIAAGVHIFQGQLLGLNAGYARPFQAGDKIVGFAKDEVDNTNGQNGDKKVDVKARGKVCLEISGLAQTDIGADVVATDDDTFEVGSDGDYFGKVLRLESATDVVVAFDFIFNKETVATETTTEETPTTDPETPSSETPTTETPTTDPETPSDDNTQDPTNNNTENPGGE